MPIFCNSNGERAPQGPQGDRGATVTAAESPSRGENGVNGHIVFAQGDFSGLASNLTLPWFSMQLHKLELDYVNKKIEYAVDGFAFLYGLLKDIRSACADLSRPRTALPLEGIAKDEINGYKRRVLTLMIQLSQGLNYYGYYENHVPLTSLALYKSYVQQLLEIGRSIEAAYKEFVKEETTALNRRTLLLSAVNGLESRITLLTEQINQLLVELDDTRGQINVLLKQQLEMKIQLENAAQAFREAVSRKGDCSFSEILTAAAAVVSIASGAGATYGGFAAIRLMKERMDAAKMKNDVAGRAKYITGELREVRGGLLEIKQGYEDIKGLLSSDVDGGKLLLDENNFEETIKKFEDLEEAQTYKKLMKAYLNLVSIRNKQILHADEMITRINETDTEIVSLQTEILSTKGRLIETENPFTASNIIFFDRANSRIKADVLRMLYLEYRALAYWSLKDIQLPDQATDRSIDHLATIHASFLTRYVSEIEERNTAPQSFQGPVEITFKRTEDPEMFSVFDVTGYFSFKLPETMPAYRALSGILVKSTKLRIKGLDFANGNLYTALLTHQGDPRFVDVYGTVIEFKHRRRTLFQYINQTEVTEIELGGLEDRFAYLSPFATWTVSLVNSSNTTPVSTQGIEEIGLLFYGIAYARYPAQ